MPSCSATALLQPVVGEHSQLEPIQVAMSHLLGVREEPSDQVDLRLVVVGLVLNPRSGDGYSLANYQLKEEPIELSLLLVFEDRPDLTLQSAASVHCSSGVAQNCWIVWLHHEAKITISPQPASRVAGHGAPRDYNVFLQEIPTAYAHWRIPFPFQVCRRRARRTLTNR
jgi:hypothetical protein